ncbi:hypothetical protein M5D96_011602 [Drosophila gunungcola]|uniref:Uncharacterized protein n=1 Tax=Drosophila gunungcola TaxID=103775 RepID=A0A9P9YEL5_9MUSC|nr:hypothetical protein M5D96_011602 [Drosophila gunungcola]
MSLRQHLVDILAGTDAGADAAVAVAAREESQVVLDEVVDGTAVALQDDHAAVVGLLADGLRVAGVAQLAAVHQLHATLHAAETLQRRRRQGAVRLPVSGGIASQVKRLDRELARIEDGARYGEWGGTGRLQLLVAIVGQRHGVHSLLLLGGVEDRVLSILAQIVERSRCEDVAQCVHVTPLSVCCTAALLPSFFSLRTRCSASLTWRCTCWMFG